MDYKFEYSKKTEDRGKTLFDAIKPHIGNKESFLDIDCGYSPLANMVIEAGHRILGFDINEIPINHLKENHPRGEWLILSDDTADFKGYSVFIILGITTPLYSCYSKTFLDSLKRLLRSNRPRTILIESANGADQEYYNKTMGILCSGEATPGEKYYPVASMEYDTNMDKASKRHYSIWKRKWDYPYWQERFGEAKTKEEMSKIHQEFYDVATIKLVPYNFYGHDKKEILPPKFRKFKDQVLFDMVMERKHDTFLGVAFWDGDFAYRMGLSGSCVDGVECYKPAITAANYAIGVLPKKLREKFKFYYGMAEDLSRFGEYDIVVNHCLEHVQDPRHVMKESLAHLALGGAAYFTPPVGHGCDSPTHLHHFVDEEALWELLPSGYSASIIRVKFQDSSPTKNCFIMEVVKNVD